MTKHFVTRMMSNVITVALATVVISCHCSAADAQSRSIHIGNSLTWDSQPLGVAALAEMRGIDHNAGYHIACNQTLDFIWNNPQSTCVPPNAEFGSFDEALAGDALDAVTLQSWRKAGTTLGVDTARVIEFIDLAQQNPANANTTFYLYTGWPGITNFQSDWLADVPNEDSTQAVAARQYFWHLQDRVLAATSADVNVIPVADVLFALDERINSGGVPAVTQLSDLYRDNVHLSHSLGRYVAGVTTFSTLFEQDPTGLTAPAGFYSSTNALYTNELYDVVHETVWQVVRARSGIFSGDFDGDRIVAQSDLDLVLLHWGDDESQLSDAWVQDLPRGTIGQEELDRVLVNWGANYATSASLGNTATPEPTSLLMMTLAAAMSGFASWVRMRRCN